MTATSFTFVDRVETQSRAGSSAADQLLDAFQVVMSA